jgi:hypothetical protein
VLALLFALTPAQTRLAQAALDVSDTATGTGALGFAQGNASYTGSGNTADGVEALSADTTGVNNTAVGGEALFWNTSGVQNTAAGTLALFNNTTGDLNTAAGGVALFNNTTGNLNTAAGGGALFENTTGSKNTADGVDALVSNTTGSNNTALGFDAGLTANGANANTTGSNDTFLGANSGPGTATQLSNATAIGDNALVSENNALVLGGTGADAVSVGIGTASPAYTLDVQGTIRATGLITGDISGNAGTVTNGVYTTSAYRDPAWLTSLAGSKITGTISGTAAGFTGSLGGDVTGTQGTTHLAQLQGFPLDLSTAPTSNQLLVFNGSTWVAGNLPSGSGSYIQNGTSQQASASFNISGTGTLGGSLQVGTPSPSYGTYLQLPLVTNSASPPTSDCTSSVAGRLVLQFDAQKSRTTLWSCSAAGVWTSLADGK